MILTRDEVLSCKKYCQEDSSEGLNCKWERDLIETALAFYDVGDERRAALEQAACYVLANKDRCITDVDCRVLANEIRDLKERK